MKKREFRCYFEGEQEKKYFDHLVKKVREIDPSISLKFKKVNKLKVLDESSTDVPKIAVFDYDSNKEEFEKRVKMCKKTRILYSNLNFDLWLLLHKKQFKKSMIDNDAYVDEIRKEYGLGFTANIKAEHNIDKILSQIEISDINKAITNAKEIMNAKLETDRIYVKRNFSYYPNPSMSIQEFLEELFIDLDINE